MNKEEAAARLILLEQRLKSLIIEVRMLSDDILKEDNA